jgi:5-methylcytosine-specific restriction enzyme subunit McrC
LSPEGSAAELRGFLFDMNRFFQALLVRFLREGLPDHDVRESGLRGMLSYDPAHNPQHRRAPQPRPDFVVRKGPEVAAVLDAKYRDLWSDPLPRDMLYQLGIYALSRVSAGRAAILYPTVSGEAREARIRIDDPVRGTKQGEIVLRPVNMAEFHSVVTAPQTTQNTRQRRRLAEQLAFG